MADAGRLSGSRTKTTATALKESQSSAAAKGYLPLHIHNKGLNKTLMTPLKHRREFIVPSTLKQTLGSFRKRQGKTCDLYPEIRNSFHFYSD